MDFAEKYITNITFDDVKLACTYKVHASYVLLGIILTWSLSIMSTILTTLFLTSVFIIIVNVAKKHNCNSDDENDDIQLMLSKLNESSSNESDTISNSNENKLDNSLNNLVLNDSDEVVVDRDQETKKKE
jgi:hypothetical protein